MNDLIRRVETIHNACGDPKKKKQQEAEEAKLDDFMRAKKRIAEEVRQIRKQIEERDALLGKTGENNPQGVRMSSDIRTRIRDVQKEVESLSTLQKKEAEKVEKQRKKGKTIPEELDKQVALRAEVVELCSKHLEECKNLEKAGYGQTASSFVPATSNGNMPIPTALPDIDDERFQALIRTDRLIDENLEVIGEGVAVLKEIATDIGKEIELQTVIMEELENHVDRTTATLNSLNKRLKDQLKKVRSCDKFVIDFICIIVILGLAGFIYNLVAN